MPESVQTADDENLRAVNDVVYAKLELDYRSLVNGIHNLSITRADIPQVYFDRFQGKGAARSARATGGVLALVLLLGLRSLRRAAAILIPLLLSLFFHFSPDARPGDLNIVNIMAFPLILGIGIDDAVHLHHRYLVERDIRRTFISTGKAVTRMGLVSSSRPGMISFAWVASMRIALCLVLDLPILPMLIDPFEKEVKEK